MSSCRATNAKPCKGARAAKALHRLLSDPMMRATIFAARPELRAETMAAVQPFVAKFGALTRSGK